MIRAAWLIFAAALLSACGETPQTSSAAKADVPEYKGTNNPYNAPGWKVGDKTAWESQLKTRLQNGQNEYNRIN